MTYNEFIQNILDTRGRFGITEGYKERHHILPRCMGGTNDEENLIDLYAREHFIAHKLLAKENPDNDKLAYAYWHMAIRRNPATPLEEMFITPEEYEEAKTLYSKIRSKSVVDWFNDPSNDEKITERNDKIRVSKLGDNNPAKRPDVRAKMSSSWNYDKHFTPQTIEKLRIASTDKHYCLGHKDSPETRAKKSAATRDENNPRARRVKCLETGEIFNCMNDAAKAFGITRQCITKCCQGKWAKAGGYHWEYVDK